MNLIKEQVKVQTIKTKTYLIEVSEEEYTWLKNNPNFLNYSLYFNGFNNGYKGLTVTSWNPNVVYCNSENTLSQCSTLVK